jgi:hypothetical protein
MEYGKTDKYPKPLDFQDFCIQKLGVIITKSEIFINYLIQNLNYN